MNEEQVNEKEKKSVQIKKVNGWKVAFLILSGFLLGSFLFVYSRVNQEREELTNISMQTTSSTSEPVLNIRSNKEQINRLVAFYLDELQANSEQKFTFVLKNEALLSGQIDVLGLPLTFYLYFDPYVMDNGNIQLKAKSLSLGALGLPLNQVLNMLSRNKQIPEWIEVVPKEETIVLRLDQFELANGMYLRGEKINLVDDVIQVSLYLPKTSEPSTEKESK